MIGPRRSPPIRNRTWRIWLNPRSNAHFAQMTAQERFDTTILSFIPFSPLCRSPLIKRRPVRILTVTYEAHGPGRSNRRDPPVRVSCLRVFFANNLCQTLPEQSGAYHGPTRTQARKWAKMRTKQEIDNHVHELLRSENGLAADQILLQILL